MVNSSSDPKILVAGASGYIGGRLVPILLKEKYSVRCLARTPEKLKARNWPSVEIIEGDVLNPVTLETALKGIDIAYYLIHSMGNQKNFEETDARGARNFAVAARETGVKRIIYLGGLAKASENLSPHLKSRQEVGQILGETGIPVTELRASIIIGSGSASFEIIRDLVNKLPIMITPRWVKSLCEPISIQNILQYLTGCLTEPRTVGQILEVGGEEVLSYKEMMKTVAEVLGKKLWMIPVPVLTPRLSAYWLNLVTTVPMSIAYPLIEGLRNDSITSNDQIKSWIKLDLLSFRESVEIALIKETSLSPESRWTEADLMKDQIISEKWSAKIFHDQRKILSSLPAESIFNTVQRIGGNVGWYYADWLWKLRGLLDRLIGGVGMRRGRRHPTELRIGDPVDFWRVEKFEPGKYLKLRAEMKLPGKAWLEFRVKDTYDQKSLFEQTATFTPSGITGIAYWYLVMPFHFLVFRNMAKRLVKSAAAQSSSRTD
ncbi:MAG: SDR family oxidoreductase [Calditrichaeota bacterium]|nr:SDR family oxidoreductase [Calditrichota bacterium]